MKSSDSIENYIKSIYSLSENDKEWVNTKDLAEKMGIKPSSVTEMLKKLSSNDYAIYEKYRGVKLTGSGKKMALKVIRKHRLWEVFLKEKLEFNWDEVHDIAEQLEHISSPELVLRLDKFLNYPKYDPHGDPIPDTDGNINISKRNLLSEFEQGTSGQLVGVNDSSSEFLQYLESMKLSLGSHISIEQIFDFDCSMSITIKQIKKTCNISKEVAQNLYLIKDE